MKKLLTTILAVMLVLTLPACRSKEGDKLSNQTVTTGNDSLPASLPGEPENTADETPTIFPVSTAAPPAESSMQSEEGNIKSLNIKVGRKDFTAVLYDNATAQALLAQLPLTLDMSELNGNEKYFQMPDRMPADNESAGSVNAGDLMLFGSDYLVLFYKSFSTSYSYTRIGFIEDVSGLAEALDSGGIQVEMSMNGQTG